MPIGEQGKITALARPWVCAWHGRWLKSTSNLEQLGGFLCLRTS
jgi:hypothetical protein